MDAAGPAALVDLDRYPLLDPDGDTGEALLDAARRQMAESGACELPGFVTPAGLATLLADAEMLAPSAYHSGGVGTPYLELPDPHWPADHPRKTFGAYGVGAVAYDLFPAASPLRQLYEWEPLMRFVEAILGLGRLYRYEDPMGALNLAVMADGDELQWHFDQTDFVVSLALRGAAEGGDFEVVPGIRTSGDERYDAVAALLAGDEADLVTLPMTPGTLLVFAGRHSIHRVSPINGPVTRLVALLAYDTKPGTVSTDVLRANRYGRVS